MTVTLRDRFLALDVMRGLTLALMIIVNRSFEDGRSYGQLQHAAWNGLTLTDLVFPSFLFVVGAALSFTLPGLAAGSRRNFAVAVLRRGFIIFSCGFLLYWFPYVQVDGAGHWGLIPLAQARIPGVLQRIAVGYVSAAFIVRFLGPRGALAFSVIALLAYWAILAGLGDLSLTGNAVLRFDLWLLGPAHLYHGEGIAFDPEGVLSSLPAVVNVIAGYLAAAMLTGRASGQADHSSLASRCLRLILWGAALFALGLVWNDVLPINKKLWTSSYVCTGVGIDLLALALLVAVVDLMHWRAWTHFFVVLGRNTLLIYLSSEVMAEVFWRWHIGTDSFFDWAYGRGFAWIGAPNGALVFAIVYLLAFWVIAFGLDRKRIYLRA